MLGIIPALKIVPVFGQNCSVLIFFLLSSSAKWGEKFALVHIYLFFNLWLNLIILIWTCRHNIYVFSQNLPTALTKPKGRCKSIFYLGIRTQINKHPPSKKLCLNIIGDHLDCKCFGIYIERCWFSRRIQIWIWLETKRWQYLDNHRGWGKQVINQSLKLIICYSWLCNQAWTIDKQLIGQGQPKCIVYWLGETISQISQK